MNLLRRPTPALVLGMLVALSSVAASVAAQDKLRQQLKDDAPSSRWIYDNWKAAKKAATKQKKPLFVVFRCVP